MDLYWAQSPVETRRSPDTAGQERKPLPLSARVGGCSLRCGGSRIRTWRRRGVFHKPTALRRSADSLPAETCDEWQVIDRRYLPEARWLSLNKSPTTHRRKKYLRC